MSTPDTTTTDAESQVRRYLMYLEDPGSLRDPAEIQRKTVAVLEAKDPIEKLKALAEVERASAVDEGSFRAGFVEHARAWAEEHGVPVAAFRELRVPDDVLQEAGFDVPRRGRGRAGGRRAAAGSAPRTRTRAPSVPVDDVKAHVLGLQGTFTLADVQAGAGGSPATIRKAVEDLVGSGQVKKLGPAKDYRGRGRAPTQYELA